MSYHKFTRQCDMFQISDSSTFDFMLVIFSKFDKLKEENSLKIKEHKSFKNRKNEDGKKTHTMRSQLVIDYNRFKKYDMIS